MDTTESTQEAGSLSSRIVALVGRRDEPVDGVRDYCDCLADALRRRGVTLEVVEVLWARQGWLWALWKLWTRSRDWRNGWVLIQYTALMWSRRGFPTRFLIVLVLLWLRRAHCGIVFHDARGYYGRRAADKIRRACQLTVMHTAYRLADSTILTVPLEQVRWLPAAATKAVFIPVGANLRETDLFFASPNPTSCQMKTVAVYGVTGGPRGLVEAADIAFAVRRANVKVGNIRLTVLGRGSLEVEDALRRELNGQEIEFEALGLLEPEQVVKKLSSADVLLFVRYGGISSRRGSAIAGIACGLPVVAYRGPETAYPVTAAGVLLVPGADRERLAEELARVLGDGRLPSELAQRSREAQRQFFCWDVIAQSYLSALVIRTN